MNHQPPPSHSSPNPDTQGNWAREHSKALNTFEQIDSLGNTGLSGLNSETKNEILNSLEIKVPKHFIDSEIINDNAIALQVIPSSKEIDVHPNELTDPCGDEIHESAPNVTHRYPDRALLKVTYQCAMYCRFCFRKYKVSHESSEKIWSQLDKSMSYIREHPEISEVILTGGDPLVLTTSKLSRVLTPLESIDSVHVVRIHTRVPIALPSRINTELLELLKSFSKPIWIVIHVNSHKEFTTDALKALSLLSQAGIPLLCQSVLLKGINDSEESLKSLLLSCIKNKIKPYYLHYPDLAKGTNHFRVSLAKALDLYKSLRGKIPGYAIPQLTVDIPGGKGKIPIDSHWVKELTNGTYEYTSPIDSSVYRFQDNMVSKS